MNLVLNVELNKKIESGDILVLTDKGIWVNVSKDEYLGALKNHILELENELKSTNDSIKEFKDKVNAKLEEYHNILKVLTEEK